MRGKNRATPFNASIQDSGIGRGWSVAERPLRRAHAQGARSVRFQEAKSDAESDACQLITKSHEVILKTGGKNVEHCTNKQE